VQAGDDRMQNAPDFIDRDLQVRDFVCRQMANSLREQKLGFQFSQ
jgi:hypothetical protein